LRNFLPHENESGYRYCHVCGTWKFKKEFAINTLCHDGYHPLCLLHVTHAASENREKWASEMLHKSGLHPASALTLKA